MNIQVKKETCIIQVNTYGNNVFPTNITLTFCRKYSFVSREIGKRSIGILEFKAISNKRNLHFVLINLQFCIVIQEYLTHYGYVDPKEMPQDFTLKDCNKKLQEFQKLARVDVTGLLDKSTMKAMNMPRCGCPDFIQLSFKNKDKPFYGNRTTYHKFYFPYHRHHHHHHNENETILSPRNPFQRESSRRTKRYVLTDSRWDKAVITYNIAKYPSRRDLQISTRDIDNAMQKAFSIWEQHTNLRFIKSSTDVSYLLTYYPIPIFLD